jgi:hypothetical protein
MFREYRSIADKRSTAEQRLASCLQIHMRLGRRAPSVIYCPVGEADALQELHPDIEFIEQRWCSQGKYLLENREKEGVIS